MNAPLLHRDVAGTVGTLHLFALFHLNLAFSSIEEERRADVIRRCYWPLLDLAQAHGPIGLEATGFTLEEIAKRDPEWCGRARALIAKGRIELIGSGYAQLIGPLVPARVGEANLRIGNEIYAKLLGVRPTLALVNEQTYSAGLVGLYLDAGYRAILMDWDNPAAHHPEWPAETRYLPQRAVGSDGRDIGLLWTSTVAFQKLQRLAHGDIALDEYLDYVRSRRGKDARALCFYANDAEIFDFRPGRYRTEEALSGASEWQKLAQTFDGLANESGCRLIVPSDALALRTDRNADQRLHLESASCPIPVKKQRKYNLARWAVTGRDDIAINAACERIYRGLAAANADDAGWKELCYLWSSDFRTHITESRWRTYCERLNEAEMRWAQDKLSSPACLGGRDPGLKPGEPEGESVARRLTPLGPEFILWPAFDRTRGGLSPCTRGEKVTSRHVEIATPALCARLDRRRGLAIRSLHFAGQPQAVIGGLPHGHFDDIALQADWYTGDCVFEAPGEHKITDLEWCDVCIGEDENGDMLALARIDTPRGPIEKFMRFHAREPRVDFDITFHWTDWGRGSLRLGHVTLLPDAFDWKHLSITTHNGGKECETYSLNDETVDHGSPVSFLVSSSYGLGMTEGWAEIGDHDTRLRVEIDRGTAPLLGFLTHRRIGGSLFCQLVLSALELDETCKPSPYREGPRQFRFGIRSVAPSAEY